MKALWIIAAIVGASFLYAHFEQKKAARRPSVGDPYSDEELDPEAERERAARVERKSAAMDRWFLGG